MKSAVLFGEEGWLIDVIHLNYIMLGILCGMFYRNALFGGSIPAIFVQGFRLSRMMIKVGIILLGSLYTFSSIIELGSLAVFLIGTFVIITVFSVIWLGKVFGLDRSMTAVLASALGVCGVSAAVATSPGVEAKGSQVAYAIATILGFGVLTIFISPYIGHALGLNDSQYGIWIGTGILNSGQVLAAALAFNPKVAAGTAVSVAEIWNIMRVISIPFVVLAVTVWYWGGKKVSSESGTDALGTQLIEKFPVFVIGFLIMVFLTSMSVFGEIGSPGGPPASDTVRALRKVMEWVFGFGLVGLGGFIDLKEIRKAGGSPLKVGLIVGVSKYLLALMFVYLFKDYLSLT